MNNNSTSQFCQLFNELDKKITEIEKENQDILERSDACMRLCQSYVEKIKASVQEYGFADKAAEISFFKQHKPRFLGLQIFHFRVFNFHRDMPVGHFADIEKHIKEEYNRITGFFADNNDFFKYIKVKHDFADEKYFLRCEADYRLLGDSSFFRSDPLFNTSHDYLVAEIMANKRMFEYLQKYTGRMQASECLTFAEVGEQMAKLTWTEKDSAMMELIYALKYSKAVDNGNASIKDIATNFKIAFNWNTGNIYDLFQHAKNRKGEPARFLLQLADIFTKKLEEGLE